MASYKKALLLSSLFFSQDKFSSYSPVAYLDLAEGDDEVQTILYLHSTLLYICN